MGVLPEICQIGLLCAGGQVVYCARTLVQEADGAEIQPMLFSPGMGPGGTSIHLEKEALFSNLCRGITWTSSGPTRFPCKLAPRGWNKSWRGGDKGSFFIRK